MGHCTRAHTTPCAVAGVVFHYCQSANNLRHVHGWTHASSMQWDASPPFPGAPPCFPGARSQTGMDGSIDERLAALRSLQVRGFGGLLPQKHPLTPSSAGLADQGGVCLNCRAKRQIAARMPAPHVPPPSGGAAEQGMACGQRDAYCQMAP